MRLRFVSLALLLAVSAQAQDFKFLPWKYDRWNSSDGIILRLDKAEHICRDGAIFYGLGKLGMSDKWRFGVTTGFAVAWEVRDGFAWRKTDGYSWKDLFAGMTGQGIVFIGEKIFDKPKRKHDEALRRQLNQPDDE